MESHKELAEKVEATIGLTPNFPKEGVLYRDISPLVANGEVFGDLVRYLANEYRGKIDYVVGLESRGFILASPVAAELGIGMIMLRKAGKLPPPVLSVDYELEYASACLEVRPDTVPPGARVLVIDDVLATGGTAAAAVTLLSQCGAEVVGMFFLMELVDLNGEAKIRDQRTEVLLKVTED